MTEPPRSQPHSGELKTVGRAMEVLGAFLDRDAWGVSALARHLNISKTITHRLLSTLTATGMLAVEAGSSSYTLGPLARHLGERAVAADNLVRLARPLLDGIGHATRETVTLAVIRGFEGFCADSVDSPQAMRMTYYRGERFPLNAGALGKALLAFQDDAFLEAYLASGLAQSLTPGTIVDPERLRAEVLRTRRLGHADSESEITPGARSVGVPVWGSGGTGIAAIVLSAPAFRLQDRAAEDALSLLRSAAGHLSAALGHTRAEPERKLAS